MFISLGTKDAYRVCPFTQAQRCVLGKETTHIEPGFYGHLLVYERGVEQRLVSWPQEHYQHEDPTSHHTRPQMFVPGQAEELWLQAPQAWPKTLRRPSHLRTASSQAVHLLPKNGGTCPAPLPSPPSLSFLVLLLLPRSWSARHHEFPAPLLRSL